MPVPRPRRGLSKSQDRLTVYSNISYQSPVYKTLGIALRYDRTLETSVQPYQRGPLASPTQWTKLDTGWVEQPGLIILQNSKDATSPLCVSGTIYSSQELHGGAEPDGLVLQILAGEALPFHPDSGQTLYIRGDGSPYSLTVLGK